MLKGSVVIPTRGRRPSRRWLALVAASVTLAGLSANQARAADVFWTFNGDGFWDVLSNWTGGTPNSGADVFINAGEYPNGAVTMVEHRLGETTINSLMANASITMSGGVLNILGPNQSQILGDLIFTNGQIATVGGLAASNLGWSGGSFTGSLFVYGGATVGSVDLDGTLTVQGFLNLGGTVSGATAAIFANGGYDILNSSVEEFTVGGLASGVIESLTVSKFAVDEGGSVTLRSDGLSVNESLQSYGDIHSEEGYSLLTFNGGSTGFFGSGSSTSVDLNVNGADVEFDSGASVYGQISIADGGYVELNDSTTALLDFLSISDGELNNNGEISLFGDFLWSGGTVSGAGLLILAGGGTISSGQGVELGPDQNLTIKSEVFWDAGDIIGTEGSEESGVVFVDADGHFKISGNNTLSGTPFWNNGNVTKFAIGEGGQFGRSGTETVFQTNFVNEGNVEVQSGSIVIEGTGMSSGLMRALSETSFKFRIDEFDTFFLNSGSEFQGLGIIESGQVRATSGAITSLAEFQVDNGSLAFSPGLYSLTSLHVANTGRVFLDAAGVSVNNFENLSGASEKTLTGGTYHISGGLGLRYEQTGFIKRNEAHITLNGEGSSVYNLGNQDAFEGLQENAGVILFQNGRDFQTYAPFANEQIGAIEADGGNTTVHFRHALTNDGIINVKGGAQVILDDGSNNFGSFIAENGGVFKFMGGLHVFKSGSVLAGDAILTQGTMAFNAGSDFADAIIDNQGGTVGFYGGTSANLGSLTLNAGFFDMFTSTAFSGAVNVHGTLRLQDGELDLRGGGSARGTINVLGANANAKFSGGIYNLDTGARVLGKTLITNGLVNLRDKAKILGPIDMFGGDMNVFDGSAIENSPLRVRNGAKFRVMSGDFVIGGPLHNWDAGTQTLSEGWFGVLPNSSLAFAGTGIKHNASYIKVIGAGAKFLTLGGRESGDDALGTTEQNSGTMDVSEGGEIAPTGSISNSGTMSATTGGMLRIGGDLSNSGSMSISNSGTMSVGGMTTNSGSMSMNGGSGSSTSMSNSGTMSVSNSGTMSITQTYLQTAGTTTVSNSGTMSATLFDIQGGSFGGDGTIIGDVSNSGSMSPGASPGLLTIMGDYDQKAAGELKLEIAGLDPVMFDRLHVTGDGSLGGTLSVIVLPGFAPKQGNTWRIMTFGGSVSGRFGSLRVAGSPVGMELVYGSNFVDLQAVPEPGSLIALGSGILAVALRRRKRHS